MLRHSKLFFLTAALGVGAVAAPGARAECVFDGSIPGTDAAVHVISVGGQTIYIEDRDYLDADADGVHGSVWIYYESNRVRGLQRGGSQVVLGALPGGGSLAQTLGLYDECTDSPTPDTLLF